MTAPRTQIEIAPPKIEVDTAEILARLQRSLAEDLARNARDIGDGLIELAIAEVPTRG